MLMERKSLSKIYCGCHLWGRGYFVAMSGNITNEVIMEYINSKEDKETNEYFSIAQSLMSLIN